jgi:glycosyltransferase involved in cell wall biosynthesis
LKKSSKIVYVLHEYGANSHYLGLQTYCQRNGLALEFYEFRVLKQLAKAVYRLDLSLLHKAFRNFWFLISIYFSEGKRIVLGIAPLDYRMLFFQRISRLNCVYYHTSWPFWAGDRVVKKKLKGFLGTIISNSWAQFLEVNIKGVFFVTEVARISMLKNYKICSPTRVVYHSADPNLFYGLEKKIDPKRLSFLFVGRLEEYKGLTSILKIIEDGLEFSLGIAGSGPLEEMVNTYAAKYSSIKYYGKVNAKALGALYRRYDIVLVPSTKGTSNFEELFGITIIEAMMCGVIPVSTSHIGPSEIIESGINGFLIDDGNLEEELRKVIATLCNMESSSLAEIAQNALVSSRQYTPDHISKLWNLIDGQ